jgi:hypothetical protein
MKAAFTVHQSALRCCAPAMHAARRRRPRRAPPAAAPPLRCVAVRRLRCARARCEAVRAGLFDAPISPHHDAMHTPRPRVFYSCRAAAAWYSTKEENP